MTQQPSKRSPLVAPIAVLVVVLVVVAVACLRVYRLYISCPHAAQKLPVSPLPTYLGHTRGVTRDTRGVQLHTPCHIKAHTKMHGFRLPIPSSISLYSDSTVVFGCVTPAVLRPHTEMREFRLYGLYRTEPRIVSISQGCCVAGKGGELMLRAWPQSPCNIGVTPKVYCF